MHCGIKIYLSTSIQKRIYIPKCVLNITYKRYIYSYISAIEYNSFCANYVLYWNQWVI